jgi:TrmH family RNA methyltransferase
MASQTELKHMASLHLSKYRYKYGQFTVEGRKAVSELFHSNLEVVKIVSTQEFLKRNSIDFEVDVISDVDYKKISQFDTPPGILALVNIPEPASWNANQPLTLALDGISDPGNLGTIIRIADWYGIKQILLSDDCVDQYNAKCISASMGSFCRIDCIYTDLTTALVGKTVYGAYLNGESVYQVKTVNPSVLVIGSESHGIRKSLKNAITNPITIPRKGSAESLNAGIATAILVDRLLNVSE